MCVKPYKDHPHGCPNFGRLLNCPPNNPFMFDQIFNLDDVYAVVTKFNRYAYFDQRRKNRPDLPEGQIRNLRNWQPITVKENDYAISDFYQEFPDKKDYIATRDLECMGVHVVKTMKNVGLIIKFPPEEFVYRIAFIARLNEGVLEKYNISVIEQKNKLKKGIKTLVRKL